MGELLALASAGCFGITHFVNGVLARRAPGLAISLYAQLGGTVVTFVVAAVWSHGTPGAADLYWGALSGAGTGIGVAFLYRAMSDGAVSVVVPVSDLGAVAIPVLAGLLVLDERPSWTGIAGICLALPAIWLLSGGSRIGETAGMRDAVIAGAGFATQFLGMAPIPAGAGLWPIVVSRAVSVVVIMPLVFGARTPIRPGATAAPAAIAGAVGSVAIVLYWLATHRQLVAVATVLAALYPAIPVVLALVFLRERLSLRQVVGMGAGAAAIAFVALPPV